MKRCPLTSCVFSFNLTRGISLKLNEKPDLQNAALNREREVPSRMFSLAQNFSVPAADCDLYPARPLPIVLPERPAQGEMDLPIEPVSGRSQSARRKGQYVVGACFETLFASRRHPVSIDFFIVFQFGPD
jgi:hypothetical protein